MTGGAPSGAKAIPRQGSRASLLSGTCQSPDQKSLALTKELSEINLEDMVRLKMTHNFQILQLIECVFVKPFKSVACFYGLRYIQTMILPDPLDYCLNDCIQRLFKGSSLFSLVLFLILLFTYLCVLVFFAVTCLHRGGEEINCITCSCARFFH